MSTIIRFKRTSTAESAPQSGRPPSLTPRAKRQVLREIEAEPNHPWSFYANNHDVASITITRTANDAGCQRLAQDTGQASRDQNTSYVTKVNPPSNLD